MPAPTSLKPIRCPAPEGVSLARDKHGVVHIVVEREDDLEGAHWALGYCHAMDRGLQILLMRILGQGRASECLDGSDETLDVDRFFRRMNWAGNLDDQLAALTEDTRRFGQRYCDGINARLQRKRPWEFKLVGYRAEPWALADSLMMTRVIGYLTLSQSQAEMERLFVEMVQAGVSDELLGALFAGITEVSTDLDRELLGRVQLGERIVPDSVRWQSAIPRAMASNNWVVSGDHTASKKPMLANDPHLEVNRLPNVWYEVAVHLGERDYLFTATMPGIPAPLVGRSRTLAWGATYTFADTVDSWIEDCKDGKYRRQDADGNDTWVPFDVRKEVIKRKKKAAVEVVFYENSHGTLDGDPNEAGLYLATRWSPGTSGADSLEAGAGMWRARTVKEGMGQLGLIETAWNWVLADTEGNIGYQMSGLVPVRKPGVDGLIPRPGWDPEYDWRGFLELTQLPRSLNPESGIIVTANQDLNHLGEADPINLPMGDYRARRIEAQLEAKRPLTREAFEALHYDVYSIHAEAYLEVLRPLLPDSEAGVAMRDWDLRYDVGSLGATLFEGFYWELYREVFGRAGLGKDVTEHLLGETGIFIDFYQHVDRILLSEVSPWFGDRTRAEVFSAAFEVAAGRDWPVRPWGEKNTLTLSHILLGGKMPRWLGFDRGPIALQGGRATPHQGQVYRSAGRVTSFAPSLRFIVDLATDELHINLAGGPSDRRFSKFYCSDLENWRTGKYRTHRGA